MMSPLIIQLKYLLENSYDLQERCSRLKEYRLDRSCGRVEEVTEVIVCPRSETPRLLALKT